MREIKCRGKAIETGEWAEGYYVFCRCYYYVLPIYNDGGGFDERWLEWVEVDPETVGQSTPFRDKNNKKIYEHDIFKAADGRTGTVAMVNGMWVIGNKDGVVELHWDADGGEVIGNIHADPELLEK